MKQNIQKKFAEYYLYFMMYSILGWIYEVFLEVVVYRWGFSNRGVLFGPYCIIYGVGALILLLSLGGLQKKRLYLGKVLITPVLVFIGIVSHHDRPGAYSQLHHGVHSGRMALGLHPVFF